MSNNPNDNNQIVWVDIPVSDLDRSIKFYKTVLATEVAKIEMPEVTFAVFHNEQGNGGCLVLKENEISNETGILVYLNTHGRIRDAVTKVTENGGVILEPVHGIGPHGFRSIIQDCEGNRLALHSHTDE